MTMKQITKNMPTEDDFLDYTRLTLVFGKRKSQAPIAYGGYGIGKPKPQRAWVYAKSIRFLCIMVSVLVIIAAVRHEITVH